jgi:hypothetical protein
MVILTSSAASVSFRSGRSSRKWIEVPPLTLIVEPIRSDISWSASGRLDTALLDDCDRLIADMRRSSECLLQQGVVANPDLVGRTGRLQEIGAEAPLLLEELRSSSQI